MRSIAVVCVRAVAAFVILSNINLLAVVIPTQLSLQSATHAPWQWATAVSCALIIAVALLALAFSRRVGGLLVAGLPETSMQAPEPQVLIRIGTFGLGLYVLAIALPELAGDIWRYVEFKTVSHSFYNTADSFRQGDVTGAIVRAASGVVVGSLLLVMARPISTLSRPTAPTATAR